MIFNIVSFGGEISCEKEKKEDRVTALKVLDENGHGSQNMFSVNCCNNLIQLSSVIKLTKKFKFIVFDF